MRRALAVALGVVALASPAAAQRRPPAGGAEERRPDLTRRFGVAAGAKALSSRDPDERERGIERLGRIGSDEAVSLLLTHEGALGAESDPRLRWLFVRALAPRAAEDPVRKALVRALADGSSCLDRPCQHDPRAARLLAGTAANALARFGRGSGADALFAAVRQGGSSAALAHDALLAHPPEAEPALPPVLDAKTAALLGDLGDLRAAGALRDAVRTADPATRAAALLALAKLGDPEAAPIARHWARSDDPKGRAAGAAALVLAAPEEAARVAATLDDRALLRPIGLALADAGAPGAAPVLQKLLGDDELSRGDRDRVLAGLARIGAFDALRAVEPRGEDGTTVAALLGAFAPDDQLAARGSADGASPGALATAVRACRTPSAKVGAADARTRTCKRATEELLASLDEAEGRARAAQALAVRGETEKARALFVTADDRAATELAVTAADDPTWEGVPTAKLLAWLDDAPALAPMAARALAARGETFQELLASTDRDVRRHVAVGLARSRADGVDGRLLAALGRELDPTVRREMLRTLAERASPLAREEIARCRDLEPDAATRDACRTPRKQARTKSGDVVVLRGPAGKTVRWERGDGVVVPVVLDADGIALVRSPTGSPGRASVAP